MYLVALLCPPLAVLMAGKPIQALLNVALTCLFMIPGIIHAFAVVNEMSGVSIRVGNPAATLAQHRLGSVAEVLRWLKTVPPVVPPHPAQ